MEQQRKFLGRLVRVLVREAEHRFLHEVQREVLVAQRELRVPIGAALDLREKAGDFLLGGQGADLVGSARRGWHPSRFGERVGW